MLTRWRAGLDPRVLGAIISELRSGPALLHAHDAHSLTLAGLAAWYSKAPLIVTRRVDFPLRRRGFWARADRVIAISDAVARVLQADGIHPKRITVVRSGIDLGRSPNGPPHRACIQQLGLPEGTLLAINLGALVPHKDHVTLLHSAALLRERLPFLHWVIAGDGPLRGELEAMRQALGLRECVHLLGHVSRATPCPGRRQRVRDELSARGLGDVGSGRHGAWHPRCIHYRGWVAGDVGGWSGPPGASGAALRPRRGRRPAADGSRIERSSASSRAGGRPTIQHSTHGSGGRSGLSFLHLELVEGT